MIENSLPVAEYPYIKDPGESSETANKVAAVSVRKKTNNWSDKDRKSKKGPTTTGGRFIIFIAGGMTYAEMRSVYELTQKYSREVLVGSTNILSPIAFIEGLRSLKKIEKLDVDI